MRKINLIPPMLKRFLKKLFYAYVIAAMLFTNLPANLTFQAISIYQESRNIVDKFWNLRQNTEIVDNFGLFEIAKKMKVSKAQAAMSGKMTLYFHKEPSSANETYNYLGFTNAEPSAYTTSGTASIVNVNATPPTSFCESSNNTGETFNRVSASAATTGNRCMGTFISAPVGQSFIMSTTDTGAVSGAIWSAESANAVSAAVNVYIYRWNGSGNTVLATDRIATFTGTDPGTAATLSNFTAVAPANNIAFAPTDRIVAIVSMNVTTAASSRYVSVFFDNSAAATQSNVTLKYTAITPNKPVFADSKDDDFTTDAATTACNTSGVTYNAKWTCLQGAAANTSGAFNAGGIGAAPLGNSSDWLWLRNKTNATTAVPSNFGATPSNTFFYQLLDSGYGNGMVRTVVNSSLTYRIGATNPTTPFNHSGLVLWTSNSDYLEVQVYSDAIKGTANSAKIVLNNSGVLGTPIGINNVISNGLYNRVWIGFQNTGGSYQTQYSTDGITWNNLGSPVIHTAFTRVGLNAFTRLNSPISSYAGAFEWFQHTLAPPPTIPDATSFTNVTEGTLVDGGRSGHVINISGSNFGTVSAGSRANCTGSVGTGCLRFITGGNDTVTDADITVWSNTSIAFTMNANLASYGGLASLQVISAGFSDSTPLDFYIYPNITSAPINGQIGSEIIISGDHFSASAGSVTVINNLATLVGTWNETSLTIRIPGQQGVGVTSGKIQLTRSDAKTSNQYPAGNFTIDGPIISSSSSSPVMNGQTGIIIHFNGTGIDTDTTPTDIRPIFWLKKTGEISISGDNVGVNYGVTTAYSDVYATFDLTGAIAGTWNLELTNMDGQVSTCFNCLTINDSGPTVTNIAPPAGFDFEILNNISIDGNNFNTDAVVKLTMAGETDLTPSTSFTRASAVLLNGGAFDFTAKKNGAWTVVVTNVSAGKSGSYTGFTVNSAIANIYQFATNTDNAEPPTQNLPEGGGIGNQPVAYFRSDIDSNKASGETLTPEIEAQLIGIGFQCVASGCPEKTSGFFAQASLPYSGITLRNWLNASGITSANDGNYHWRVRLTNSSGKIGSWIEFGTDPQETNVDFYLDNTPPSIAGECPAVNITDSQATIDWNTSDLNSGINATAQVEYKLGIISESWGAAGSFYPAAPKPIEAGPHAITLSGLSAGSNYVFRARSKDDLGNETTSGNCAFTTAAAMPIKTVEQFIMQEEGTVTDMEKAYNFTVTIPENPGNLVSLKSAMIEINGISGASVSNQTIYVGFLRENPPTGPATGDNFIIESSSEPMPFMILFNALNPPGADQSNMQDLAVSGPSGSQNYTLFLKGTTIPTYVLGAKLILTYSYTP